MEIAVNPKPTAAYPTWYGLLKVRKIDRKLKACHNLLLDPESDLYKQKAAAAQQQLKEDRDSKVRPCTMHYVFVRTCFMSCKIKQWTSSDGILGGHL